MKDSALTQHLSCQDLKALCNRELMMARAIPEMWLSITAGLRGKLKHGYNKFVAWEEWESGALGSIPTDSLCVIQIRELWWRVTLPFVCHVYLCGKALQGRDHQCVIVQHPEQQGASLGRGLQVPR